MPKEKMSSDTFSMLIPSGFNIAKILFHGQFLRE